MRHDPPPLMLFAAGFGTRMRPLTDTLPKPLVPVAGRALIDHALALADQAGVARRVVNLHYRGDQLARHLAPRADVMLAWERERILDTGGGLKAAFPLLGRDTVLTLNTDAVWTGVNPLTALMQAWDGARMDALLLMLPAGQAVGTDGRSDFVMDRAGRIDWARGRAGVIYLGAQMIRADLVAAQPGDVFSLRQPWQDMIDRGRAYGLIHRGGWCDVGHPGGIPLAEAMLAQGQP